jgi:hypothetical protein
MGSIYLSRYTIEKMVILIQKKPNRFAYKITIVNSGINYTKKRLFVIPELSRHLHLIRPISNY